jgi:hypothetical protein
MWDKLTKQWLCVLEELLDTAPDLEFREIGTCDFLVGKSFLKLAQGQSFLGCSALAAQVIFVYRPRGCSMCSPTSGSNTRHSSDMGERSKPVLPSTNVSFLVLIFLGKKGIPAASSASAETKANLLHTKIRSQYFELIFFFFSSSFFFFFFFNQVLHFNFN